MIWDEMLSPHRRAGELVQTHKTLHANQDFLSKKP